jgi:fluoride exporter
VEPRVAGVRPDELAAVALGGSLGAPARYGVAQVIHVAPGSFPWATFATNVAGSFVLGVVLGVLVSRPPSHRRARLFLTTGFLGAFTTFSTFVVEVDVLAKDGGVGIALAYVVASLVVGLGAAGAGLAWGRQR